MFFFYLKNLFENKKHKIVIKGWTKSLLNINEVASPNKTDLKPPSKKIKIYKGKYNMLNQYVNDITIFLSNINGLESLSNSI